MNKFEKETALFLFISFLFLLTMAPDLQSLGLLRMLILHCYLQVCHSSVMIQDVVVITAGNPDTPVILEWPQKKSLHNQSENFFFT